MRKKRERERDIFAYIFHFASLLPLLFNRFSLVSHWLVDVTRSFLLLRVLVKPQMTSTTTARVCTRGIPASNEESCTGKEEEYSLT